MVIFTLILSIIKYIFQKNYFFAWIDKSNELKKMCKTIVLSPYSTSKVKVILPLRFSFLLSFHSSFWQNNDSKRPHR